MKKFEDFHTKVSWKQIYRGRLRKTVNSFPKFRTPIVHYSLLDSEGKEYCGTKKDLVFAISLGIIK